MTRQAAVNIAGICVPAVTATVVRAESLNDIGGPEVVGVPNVCKANRDEVKRDERKRKDFTKTLH